MTKRPIPYFSLVQSEEDKSADIVIFGDIRSKGSALDEYLFGTDADVSAYDLVGQLSGIPEGYDITVHINSNGGEVKEGLAIYNSLKTRNATTICEGFAASAASLIFMAGKRRVMNSASLLFIHQAVVSATGNPDDLEKVASDLRIITDAAANVYREGGVTCSDKELMTMLKAETWIKAENALEFGFATEIAGADEGKGGTVKNDAMKSVIAAVTRRATPVDERLDRITEKLVELTEIMQKSTAAKPVAAGACKKGFFNLGGRS